VYGHADAEPLEYLAYNPVNNYAMGIYQISMSGSKRCYIGSSKGLGGRLRRHAEKLVEGKHHNVKLQRAWDEHGSHRFVFRIVEQGLHETQLSEREQFWIDHYKAADIGFNILPTVGRKKFEPVPLQRQPVAINHRLIWWWIAIGSMVVGWILIKAGGG